MENEAIDQLEDTLMDVIRTKETVMREFERLEERIMHKRRAIENRIADELHQMNRDEQQRDDTKLEAI